MDRQSGAGCSDAKDCEGFFFNTVAINCFLAAYRRGLLNHFIALPCFHSNTE